VLHLADVGEEGLHLGEERRDIRAVPKTVLVGVHRRPFDSNDEIVRLLDTFGYLAMQALRSAGEILGGRPIGGQELLVSRPRNLIADVFDGDLLVGHFPSSYSDPSSETTFLLVRCCERKAGAAMMSQWVQAGTATLAAGEGRQNR
jgi:hypothetical protein